jgi:hypothetical protein
VVATDNERAALNNPALLGKFGYSHRGGVSRDLERRRSSRLVTELEEKMICEHTSFVVEVRECCAVVRSK